MSFVIRGGSFQFYLGEISSGCILSVNKSFSWTQPADFQKGDVHGPRNLQKLHGPLPRGHALRPVATKPWHICWPSKSCGMSRQRGVSFEPRKHVVTNVGGTKEKGREKKTCMEFASFCNELFSVISAIFGGGIITHATLTPHFLVACHKVQSALCLCSQKLSNSCYLKATPHPPICLPLALQAIPLLHQLLQRRIPSQLT